MNMDYLAYHAIVAHFDHTRGFENVQALLDAIWSWLSFCTVDEKSAMGQVLFRKYCILIVSLVVGHCFYGVC